MVTVNTVYIVTVITDEEIAKLYFIIEYYIIAKY